MNRTGSRVALAGFVALLAVSSQADAGNQTYCVGGAACDSPQVRRAHRVWHFHCNLSDGTTCYKCYDEQDDSCETDFLKKNKWKGWKKVDAYQCARQRPAPAPVFEQMNRGVPVVDPAEETRRKQKEMEKLLEEAKREAEKLKAE